MLIKSFIFVRLGKEVELQCLRLFIKSLTRDINEYEVKYVFSCKAFYKL